MKLRSSIDLYPWLPHNDANTNWTNCTWLIEHAIKA